VRILLFTSAIAVGTALLAGVFPALRNTRFELAPALRGPGGAVVAEQARMRKSLVVAQVALAFLLLITAGLFARTLKNLFEVDPGFRIARTLTFQFDLAASGYDEARARAFAKTFQERISGTPGVSSVAFAFQSLLGDGGWGMGFTVEGFTPQPGEGAGSMANAVSPGYFRAMGIRVLSGREFDERDDKGFAQGWAYSIAVVNETSAKLYFGGANPVGRRIGFGANPGTETRVEIVGLVSDSKYTGIRQENPPQVYVPYLQARIEGVTAFVHTEHDPRAVMSAIRREMTALDADIALYGVRTLEERVDRSLGNERLIATLSVLLSGMATLLAIVGLYGVVAYTVQRRAREIGIRIALGAQSGRIAAGVLMEAGMLVTLGLAIGFAASWWLGRYVESQLYGVTPNDPPTILLAALVLGGVAAAASLFPARRAAAVAPMEVLRGD
jgi:predicted permease